MTEKRYPEESQGLRDRMNDHTPHWTKPPKSLKRSKARVALAKLRLKKKV